MRSTDGKDSPGRSDYGSTEVRRKRKRRQKEREALSRPRAHLALVRPRLVRRVVAVALRLRHRHGDQKPPAIHRLEREESAMVSTILTSLSA